MINAGRTHLRFINMAVSLFFGIFLIFLMFCLAPAAATNAYAASATNPYPSTQTDDSGKTSIPCTYVAWQQAYDRLGIALPPRWGNGGAWLESAKKAGYSTGNEPKVDSIAVFQGLGTNSWGHVAYVTAVNGSKISVVEGGKSNVSTNGTYNATVGSTLFWNNGSAGNKLIGYIYLKKTEPTSSSSVSKDDLKSLNTKAKTALANEMKKLKNAQPVTNFDCVFADFDNDGIDEVLCDYHPLNGGSGHQVKILDYSNGKVRHLLDITKYGLSKVCIYKKTKGLMLYGHGHGGEWYSYYKLDGSTYSFVAEKARQSKKDGWNTNGPWSYYSSDNPWISTTAAGYKKLISKVAAKTSKTYAYKQFKTLSSFLTSFTATAKNKQLALAPGRTITYSSFDVTGDKKADKVQFKTSRASYNSSFGDKTSIYVNGKRAYTLKQGFMAGKAKIMVMKNGRAFIYLYMNWGSSHGKDLVLMYKNGKFVNAVDAQKMLAKTGASQSGIISAKAVDNMLKINFYAHDYAGGDAVKVLYSYVYKNGKLRRTNTTGAWVNNQGNAVSRNLTANKTIEMYSSPQCQKKISTIRKGQQLVATHVYLNNGPFRLKVKVNGKTGWVKLPNKTKNFGIDTTFSGMDWAR